jgi:hypothetical protein
MPQGPVRPLRLHSRNAKAVKERHIGVEASRQESPRGDCAVKIPSWTGSTHAAGWREVSKKGGFCDSPLHKITFLLTPSTPGLA